MPARSHLLSSLIRLLGLCALALGACAAPTAAPPTAVPTESATATALPPTAAATAQNTQAAHGAVPATFFTLEDPAGLTFDADGNLYVSECGSSPNILKVDRTGLLTVFAGSGDSGFSGDGGPALSAQLGCPTGLAVDGDGNLYVADLLNNRIRRIDRSGVISTVAGSGPVNTGGFAGDGGPATMAHLHGPADIAFDGDGNLYIADAGNNRVRRVDRQGNITTVAGSGDLPGYSGDGGQATAAQLATIGPGNTYGLVFNMGVAVDADGNLYFIDTFNYRIRKVDKQGIITTVAGNGQASSSGDGGPATAASLTFAAALALDKNGLAIDNQGNLYFSEGPAGGVDSHRIRKVDKKGIITTVAGIGDRGFAVDGGLAVSAGLFYPSGIAFDQAGNLYIVDNGNNRVRKVDKQGIITTVAGGRP